MTDWHLLTIHFASVFNHRSLQQLNFYSFRKIKYADTIRIDPQLEAETANYWRFRHENFRRGRPDLLSEIKRMNGGKTEKKDNTAAAVPVAAVDSEVQALKKRLEEMNKNIDQLTAMVEKVNLKQEEHEKEMEHVRVPEHEYEQTIGVGNKRKKVVLADPIPEPEPVGSLGLEPVVPMSAHSSSDHMALDDLATLPLPPTLPLPDPAPMSTLREMSTTSNITDTEFVDQLLTQFDDEDDVEFLGLDESAVQKDVPKDNRPDPELMRRLSDALAVLPKNIQEMIVDRLIQSITSPDFEKNVVLKEANTTPQTPEDKPPAVPVEMDADKQREVAVPLAAATLAALLQHLCQQAQGNEKVPNKAISKILPVVPVHA